MHVIIAVLVNAHAATAAAAAAVAVSLHVEFDMAVLVTSDADPLSLLMADGSEFGHVTHALQIVYVLFSLPAVALLYNLDAAVY